MLKLALILLIAGFLSGCTTPQQASSPGPYPDNYQNIVKSFVGNKFSNSDNVQWKITSQPQAVCIDRGIIKHGIVGAGFGNLSCYAVIVTVEKKTFGGQIKYDYYNLYIRDGVVNGHIFGRNDHDVVGTLIPQ